MIILYRRNDPVLPCVQLRTLDAPEPVTTVGKSRPVTCMAVSPVSDQLAVGYGDGSVCHWACVHALS